MLRATKEVYMIKLISSVVSSAVLAGALLTSAAAAPPSVPGANGNKLQCFDGHSEATVYGGSCTFDGLVAQLDTTVILNGGSYAGVYIQNSNLDGKFIGDVANLSFNYEATGTTVATGGSPRLTLPIDYDGNGATDSYVSIDTLGCNDGDPNVGTLDVINDPTCTVSLNDGSGSWANWAAFVAAHPEYQVTSGGISFIIADQPGTWDISNVRLGKGPARPLSSH